MLEKYINVNMYKLVQIVVYCYRHEQYYLYTINMYKTEHIINEIIKEYNFL